MLAARSPVTRLHPRAQNSSFAPLISLAQTLETWSEPLAAIWRFTRNNGITEGFHRKMKLIQRRAYDFKNFFNYRSRHRSMRLAKIPANDLISIVWWRARSGS